MMKSILIALMLFSLQACCTREKGMTDAAYNELWKSKKYAAGETFLPEGMAGCTYLIRLEDGKMLEPVNLPDTLRKEKLKLWLVYHYEKKMSSVCMMGDIVTVDDVQIRK